MFEIYTGVNTDPPSAKGQEESPVTNALSVKWPFAFKNAFNSIILCFFLKKSCMHTYGCRQITGLHPYWTFS